MRVAAILALSLCAASVFAAGPSPIEGAKQVILVVSPDWDSTAATMRRFDRTAGGWRESGRPVDVVIGRSGLAWGRGVNRDTGAGPIKKEGDGKAPAGVFRLGTAFGFGSMPDALRLPYRELRDSTECVDDVESPSYNHIVERDAESDWKSSEKMRSIAVYERGVVVLHNDPVKAAGGSCIFLHLVDPRGKPTAGCTSMPPAAIDALLRWADPKAQPLLVQLPRSEYERLRKSWQLP